MAHMRATVPFSDLGISSPVSTCCYCAPEDLGGFIDVTAYDAHMINLRSGEVSLTLRREENSYFWEVIAVEPVKAAKGLDVVIADCRV
jgi:hypothetical protein